MRAGRDSASSIRALSSSAGASCAGTVPPKYFSIMLTVRERRLPRSFTRSLFMRVMSASFEKTPSEPNGTSLSRK